MIESYTSKDSTALGSVINLATDAPAGTKFVEVIVSDGAVRFLPDGNDPTTSAGAKLASGTVMNFIARRNKLANMRFIKNGSDTPTLHIIYRR